MSAVSASRVRLARLTDFRALGAFYSHRDKTDRAMFHPFPEGRLIAPLVFLILLASQRVNRTLLRLHPTWAFIFVVYPGESQGAIDGFVYLRVRRKENEGYVANIGTQVGPLARGRGVGALLITLLIDEARTLGVVRIETEAYEENNASIRMCEKLGFKLPADPTSGRQRDEFGIAVTMVLNLAARVESGRPASAVTPGPAPVLSRTAASTRPVLRKGKLSDFWALGKLYSDRSDEDRANFHPFPEGRLIAPLVFLVLLACQRFRQQLIRIHASWAFAFVVNPGARPGTINGFAYLRVRRREPSGYVGNIGPLVGPLGRGNGLSRYLIATLINDARTWGLRRVEVEVYVRNTASVRMGEKLGSKAADEPTAASKKDAYGVMITQVLDVDQVVPPSAVTSTLPAHREEPSRSLVATDSAEPASVPKPSRFRRADVAALIALMASFAVIATLRLLILFSYPYPPSGDVAEQLYWSHIWLGTAFPSPATIWDVPPVYLFLVYIPLTHLFPLFTGQRLLMGVVPALLAFPTYLLLRECRVNRFFSVFGASLLALAAPVSLMVTWNAGYDLFGMFWALLFFAGLVGALRTHRRSYMLLAAVSFGLTAGSHDFAFVFICLAFGLIIALALLLLPDRRATFRSFGIVLGVGLLCAAPFALIYYTLAGETANVGGAVTIGALKTLGRGFLPFSWAAVDTWSTLVYVDAAVSLLAIGVVVWRRLRRPETPVLLGILLSAASLSIAYPQVADRGLYFLPLGLYPVVAVFCQILYDAFSSRDTASPLEGLPPDAAPAARLQAEALQLEISEPSLDLRRSGWVLRQRRSRRWLKPTVAIVLIAAFLIPNAEQSLTVMSGAEHYYIELTPDEVPILNWLAHNTPANAAVYSSSSGLEKWIWGYANRQSFAPTSLNLDATNISYKQTYQADLAAMGQDLSGNQYLAVAQNAPAPVGAPLIYLRTQYDWNLLFSTSADDINLTVNASGVSQVLDLANANLVSDSPFSPCATCAGQDQLFTWPNSHVTILQQTNLSGQSVRLSWHAIGGSVTAVNFTTFLTPAYFGTLHLSVPRELRSASLMDRFSAGGSPLSLTVSGAGGVFAQQASTGGWTKVSFSGGPRITFQFRSLASFGSATPFTTDSGSILGQLGVTYVVTDYDDSVPGFGYLLYQRCVTADEIPGMMLTEVFQSGSLYVFALTPS